MYWIFDINQITAKAKTAAVVKKRPIAAVAVNSDKFIVITIYRILITTLDLSCIRNYF